MEFVDMHCHSTASDGTTPPREVVRLAKENELVGLCLTDHDTVGGVEDAADEARILGIDFIAGIEISAEYPRPGTLHMLGYGVDPSRPSLRDLTKTLLAGRGDRNGRLIEKLNELGIGITLEDVKHFSGEGVMGRPHFAQALIKLGVVTTPQQAFNEYLGQGGKAYLDKERLTAAAAIELIHEAGGLAVLAHPSQLQKTNDAQLEGEIKNLKDFGLDGIETIHSDHRESFIDKLDGYANKYGLLKTGGSDFHGRTKPHIKLGKVGGRRVPRELFETLKEKLAAARR